MGDARSRFDQALEQINVVIAVNLLHHRGDPFQPHAGIHRWFGQRMKCAGAVTVILHKHQIPDFNVTIAFGIGRTGRATFDARSMVIKNFGTRAAGAGIAHLPEIIHGRNPHQS